MSAWDVIPYEDVIWGPRLGRGAFGSVYKGTYLGLDIALKEVEASTTYKVEKYFEREWRIMRECRHPNIVQFLGLCHSPEDDGRIFIVSEYVPKGTVRSFILGKREFPWRMRISFATDIARALAYLHARECLHRDLKGENLLVTSNDRVKMTDFGFARITAPDAADKKSMTYCGTDWYMSPEMMNGQPFGLPTDVFTLGILLAEIAARKVVDSKTFQVNDETHTLNAEEVFALASPGCPRAFLELALDCCAAHPDERPKMPEILNRLRIIELDVLSRFDEAEHVGSVRLVKLQHGARGMPSFDPPAHGDEEEEAVRQMEAEALHALSSLTIDGSGVKGLNSDVSDRVEYRTARWTERPSGGSFSSEESFEPRDRLLRERTPLSQIYGSPNSATVSDPDQSFGGEVQNASVFASASPPVALNDAGSVMTIRPPTDSFDDNGEHFEDALDKTPTLPQRPLSDIALSNHPVSADATQPADHTGPAPTGGETATTIEGAAKVGEAPKGKDKLRTRYQIQREQEREDEAAGLLDRVLGTHRFTVITKTPDTSNNKKPGITSAFSLSFWTKPSPTGSGGKCKVCSKRLGLRPSLQCDDCSTTVHATCSHSTPRDCHLSQQVDA